MSTLYNMKLPPRPLTTMSYAKACQMSGHPCFHALDSLRYGNMITRRDFNLTITATSTMRSLLGGGIVSAIIIRLPRSFGENSVSTSPIQSHGMQGISLMQQSCTRPACCRPSSWEFCSICSMLSAMVSSSSPSAKTSLQTWARMVCPCSM